MEKENFIHGCSKTLFQKRTSFILILLYFFNTLAYSQTDYYDKTKNWAVVKQNDKKGIIDLVSGKLFVPLIYDEIIPEEEYIVVKAGEYKTFLDLSTGKELLPLLYNDVSFFSTQYIWAGIDDKFGFLDRSGKEVVPFIYNQVSYIGGDLYELSTDSSCIVIDRELNTVHDNCQDFKRKKTKYMCVSIVDKDAGDENSDVSFVSIINADGTQSGRTQYLMGAEDTHTGEMVIPLKYRRLDVYQDRYFIVSGKWSNGTAIRDYGIVNLKGEEITPLIYDQVRSFYGKNVVALFKSAENSHWILVDTSVDSPAKTSEYDRIEELRSPNQGLLIVTRKGKYGLYNLTECKEWLSCEYDNISYADGYYRIQKENKFGLFGQEDFILPCIYESVYVYLWQKIIAYQQNKKWGAIDFKGNEICPAIYDNIEEVANEQYNILLTKEGKTTAIDCSTKKELPTINYNGITLLASENPIIVNGDDGYHMGLIDGKTGEIILPCIYSHLLPIDDSDYIYAYHDYDTVEVIDLKTKKSILPFKTRKATWLSSSHVSFEKDDKYGIYNIMDKTVDLPAVYEEIYLFDRTLICKKNGKYGVLDFFTKKENIPFEYEEIIPYRDHFPE